MRANAANRLLDHYRATARDLPWRSPPGGSLPDAYRVWLSEVMLQQTTVATVSARFADFVDRFPDVEALAAAPPEQLMRAWAGLGYYARARNLHSAARAIVAAGAFPKDEAGWRALPGIGDYTAAAIAAIALGQRAVPVDTNIARVVARLEAIETPLPAGMPTIRAAAEALAPRDRSGDFAQAMMDLGATICRPRAPDCPNCPLAQDCQARALGRPEDFPRKVARRERPLRHGDSWWIRRAGEVRLVRRPARGLLGGMAALPGSPWSDQPIEPQGRVVARIEHGFTHFTLSLRLVERDEVEADGWWQPIDRLAEAGLPTLYRKAIAAGLKADAA